MESSKFELLPAIDLSGGRVARMRGGDPLSLEVVEGAPHPVELARRFVADGARWIHLADLDAARGLGMSRANVEVLGQISRLPLRVQAGGGLDPAGADLVLNAGADRAVLGSGWLGKLDRPHVMAMLREHRGDVLIGLDISDDRLSPRGGAHADAPLEPVLRWLADGWARPPAVVVTEVERDGRLSGVNVRHLVDIAERIDIPVIASGGIGSLDDLRALGAAWPAIRGAIVGRALHDGAFSLPEALQAVALPDD